MAHIHTEPGQHDFTTSAFIFRTDDNELKLLLHMHKKLGKLAQPGGHIELDETPWQAISHELEEETGYELGDLEVLQPERDLENLPDAIVHPVPFSLNTHRFADTDHFHTDIAFAFRASALPSKLPNVDAGESSDLRWFTQKELAELSDDDIIANVRESALNAFETCAQHWNAFATTGFKL